MSGKKKHARPTWLLHLPNVLVDEPNNLARTYQATLRYQNGQFVLIDANLADTSLSQGLYPLAAFNLSSNLLTLPAVYMAGKSYQATLTHVDNYKFELKTLTPNALEVITPK